MTEEKGELTDAELERLLAEYNAEAEAEYGDGDAELERFLAEYEEDEDGEVGWLKDRSWKGFGGEGQVRGEEMRTVEFKVIEKVSVNDKIVAKKQCHSHR